MIITQLGSLPRKAKGRKSQPEWVPPFAGTGAVMSEERSGLRGVTYDLVITAAWLVVRRREVQLHRPSQQ